MNNYRKISLLALTALALSVPALNLVSCSSGASDDAEATSFPGIMTTTEFASLKKSFQIYSAGSILIKPLTLVTPKDQVTNRAEVFAELSAVTTEGTSEPVQVHCTYYQFGNVSPTDPPTTALMEVTFASPNGQNNTDVVTALGLREVGVGNVLSGLVFDFNFQSNIVNVSASGSSGSVVQPGDGGTGEDTNTEEEITNLPYAVRNSF